MSKSLDFVYIDVDEFFDALKLNKLGTGAVATRIRVSPDDIQRLIALSGGPKETISKLVDLLGSSFILGDEADDTFDDFVEDIDIEDVEEEDEFDDEDDDFDEEDDDEEQDTSEFVLEGATIDSILDAVEAGRVTAEEVLQFEKAKDKPRVTLIESLE